MTLPPLANLFAMHSPDPTVLLAVEADLRSSGEFDEVWRPAPGWVAGSKPLPGGDPDGRAVREAGLAFAEGRDVVVPHAADNGRRDTRRVVRLADEKPEQLDSLPGDFGFIRFRPHGEATVVRSCAGLVPFYVRRWNGGIAIATQLGRFIQFLSGEPEIDPLPLAVWTTGYGFFPDRRTFLKNTPIVDRGGFAVLTPARPIRFGRYWDPRPDHLPYPTEAQRREHAERLRTLLLAKLERDLDPDGGNLLTLSGGVDSSSLAVLATRVVGRRIMTWSLVPAPDDLYLRDMSYIESLWELCGVTQRWVVPLEAHTRIELLQRAPRLAFPVVHPALCALPDVSRQTSVSVLFGGEFADEVCGSAFTIPDWSVHTTLPRLLFMLHRLPTGPKDLLRWLKNRSRKLFRRPVLPFPPELPAFVRDEVHAEYRDWLNRRLVAADDDNGTRPALALRADLDGFVPMNWEACSALGIRRSFPFFGRDVLELAFECHPAELVGRGTKNLLKRACRGDVDRRYLQRPKSSGVGRYLQDADIVVDAMPPDGLDAIVRSEWFGEVPKRVHHFTAFGIQVLARHMDNVVNQKSLRQRGNTTSVDGSLLQIQSEVAHGQTASQTARQHTPAEMTLKRAGRTRRRRSRLSVTSLR